MSQALPDNEIVCREKHKLDKALMEAACASELPVGYILVYTVQRDRDGVCHQLGIMVGPNELDQLEARGAALMRSTIIEAKWKDHMLERVMRERET